ncbi:hypothetical protein V501_07116 [Pseudogymnoascus sp. VKM F-4519 (FW-2642)]|nr:hypothetical protein V501_07116 [Pseudogymnoascus sp. VKM F-4519 (FW-2642)]
MQDETLDTETLSQALVSSISRILIQSKIPCILWGDYLLTIYGVPSIVESINFSVPDDLVAAAEAALQNKGLADCMEPKSCNTISEFRTSPAPAAHFHVGPRTTISIYKQSSTFWSIPSLTLERLVCSHDIILASDSRLPPPRPGRGSGVFHEGYFPVYIPTAHRLYWGLAMITYIEEYVDGDGLLDEAVVEDRCRRFYSGMKLGEIPMASLLKELEASFAGSFT